VNARAMTILLIAVLVVLTAVEWLFAPHYRPVFPWHHMPGYSALIGLVAAAGFAALMYFVLKPLLQREEDGTADGGRRTTETKRNGK
jgi:hypothetical protein